MRIPSSTLQSRNWKSRHNKIREKANRCKTCCCFILIIIILIPLLIFQINSLNEYSSLGFPVKSSRVDKSELGNLISSITVENELSFIRTIKDCTDHEEKTTKCMQFLPKQNKDCQRIAILSLPGHSSNRFFQLLQKSLIAYYNGNKEMMEKEIQLIQTSRVPPYGYGKTHGYTKIVRLMNRPLLHEVAEAIQFIIQLHDKHRNKSEEFETMSQYEALEKALSHEKLMSNTIRQMMRWHCRLSHVAAHTLMYNIDISSILIDDDELMKDILNLVKAIIAKVGEGPSRISVRDSTHMRKMEKVKIFLMKELMSSSLPQSSSDVLSILQNVINGRPAILKTYQNVIKEEMQSTNNLQKWPCLSFWFDEGLKSDSMNNNNVGSKDKDDDFLISFLLAKDIVPDCSGPFSKCVVKIDHCEEEGDVLCQ